MARPNFRAMTNTTEPVDEYADGFIRSRELLRLIPLGMTAINTLEREGKFPRRVSLTGGRAVAWHRRAVLAWIKARPVVSNPTPAVPKRRGRIAVHPTNRTALPASVPELPSVVLDQERDE